MHSQYTAQFSLNERFLLKTLVNKDTATRREMSVYTEFSLVHFVELSILSPQKCNFVLSVTLQNKKELEKMNTLAKNSV